MSSTNKTPILGLNQWVGSDYRKTADDNADNSLIDQFAEDVNASLSDYTKIPGSIDDTGSANIYVITLASAPTAYAKYQTFKFKATNANTGASTLNVNGLGVKALVKNVNVALVTGDILANQIVTAVFDGTNFQIIPDVKAQLALKSNLASPDFTGTPTIATKKVATTEYAVISQASILNGFTLDTSQENIFIKLGNLNRLKLVITSTTDITVYTDVTTITANNIPVSSFVGKTQQDQNGNIVTVLASNAGTVKVIGIKANVKLFLEIEWISN